MTEGDNGTPYTDYELSHGLVDDRTTYVPRERTPETYSNEWIKSSHSGGYNNCVEVRPVDPRYLEIRDSKITDGQTIKVTPDAFRALVSLARF